MSLGPLANLVRANQLKAEPRNDAEVTRLLAMARTRLHDAQVASVSREGRFISAYNAAHAAALAALRWHGYRSEHRYMVFQCLTHTLNWAAPHQKRNLAEYEGFLEVEESAIKELSALVIELIGDVAKLVTPQSGPP